MLFDWIPRSGNVGVELFNYVKFTTESGSVDAYTKIVLFVPDKSIFPVVAWFEFI